MLPVPVTQGAPLKSAQDSGNNEINIDFSQDGIKEIGLQFKMALAPLVKTVIRLSEFLRKALAPDPNLKADRGKDLFDTSKLAKGEEDPIKFESKGGKGLFLPLFLALSAFVIGFKDQLQGLINAIKFPAILAGLGATIKAFSFGFINITRFFRKMKLLALLGAKGPIFGFIRVFTKVAGSVKGFIAPLTKFFGFLAPLGKMLGKLALPITIIFSIIDAITGFVEGYKDQGILDGIFTAIGKVLAGLVGLPLDFIKNIFAFIAGKLGFDKLAKDLKEFSFADLIKNFFGNIVNFFQEIPKMFERAVRGVLETFGLGSVADSLFGKSEESEIERRRDIQKSGGSGAMRKKKEKADFNVKVAEANLAKAKESGNKQAIENQEKKLAAAKEKQSAVQKEIDTNIADSGAVSESVMLQTSQAGIDVNKMLASGMSPEEVIKASAGALEGMNEAEKKFFVEDVQSKRGMSKEKLFEQSEMSRKATADILEKDFVAGDMKRFQTEADIMADKRKLPKGGEISKVTQIKDGKPIEEGKVLDQASGNVLNVGGSTTGGPVDNSTTDNSVSSPTNNTTVNNYGGDDGNINTRHHNIFNDTTTAQML
jgi:hypothetical protein